MKIVQVTPYSNGEVIQVIAESRRGRRYECITNRRGAITLTRTFRQEPSPEPPRYQVWLYLPIRRLCLTF
jgi:hypothetical protein